MGKRQEAALLTRKRIIDAMKALLNEKRADTINIEDITTKAGVAKGSFYTYFKRKEDVISVIAFEQYDNMKEIIMNSTDNVYQRLCTYLKGSAQIIESNTLQIAQNWMKSVTAPLPSEENGIRKYTYDRENIHTIFNEALNKKELSADTPVELLTEYIMNVYYGAVANWCITGTVTLIESINHFCDIPLKTILEHYWN